MQTCLLSICSDAVLVMGIATVGGGGGLCAEYEVRERIMRGI